MPQVCSRFSPVGIFPLWLNRPGAIHCTIEEKFFIRSNLPNWLGSALTTEIESALD